MTQPRNHAGILLILALALLAAVLLPADVAQAKRGPAKAGAALANGYVPADAEWPWVAAITSPDRPTSSYCTGSLIAPDRVLTAAHCTDQDGNLAVPVNPAGIQVTIGRKNLADTATGIVRRARAVANYPQASYVNKVPAYDLAVVFLDSPVTGVPLAPIGQPADSGADWGSVMGYGHWNYDHSNSQTDGWLRAASYDIAGDSYCGSWLNQQADRYFSSIMLCAEHLAGEPYRCITHGDSGGPLMVRNSAGQWVQIGVTSWIPTELTRGCPYGGGGPFVWAWLSGAMASWPLTVQPPPVADGGGDGGGGGGGPQLADASMARSELPGYIRELIRDHTKGRIKKLRRSCARESDTGFWCALRFRVRRHAYKGRAHIWSYVQDNRVYWTYTFAGKRYRPSRPGTARRLSWRVS